MEEERGFLEGDLIDKTGQVLGLERRFVVPAMIFTAVLMGVAIFIAVVSVGDVREQFLSDERQGQSEAERLRQTVVEIVSGGSIPDVASGEAHVSGETCGPHLSGETGLKRGWLWIEDEELCRRVHRSGR